MAVLSGPGLQIGVDNLPGLGGIAGIWQGNGAPTAVPAGSRPNTPYLDLETFDVYILGANMDWTYLANIKGPSGDTVLDPDELQELVADAVAEVEQDLDPPIDLSVLFENAIA